MTVILSKKEKLESMLEKLEESSRERKRKTFAELSGKLSDVFKGDPVEIQKKVRKEWER